MLRVLVAVLSLVAFSASAAELQQTGHRHVFAGKAALAPGDFDPYAPPPQAAGLVPPPYGFRSPVGVLPLANPNEWGYRPAGVASALPYVFLAPTYGDSYWATLGLRPPPPGYQWVRSGPDLLLVNINNGHIAETRFDVMDGGIDQ